MSDREYDEVTGPKGGSVGVLGGMCLLAALVSGASLLIKRCDRWLNKGANRKQRSQARVCSLTERSLHDSWQGLHS